MRSRSAQGSGEQGGRVDGSGADGAGRGSAADRRGDPRAFDPRQPDFDAPRAGARRRWTVLAARIAVGVFLLVAGASVSFALARSSNPDAEREELVVLMAVVAGVSVIASTIFVVVARRVAGGPASSFVVSGASLGASYFALVAIAVALTLLDETGESLAWLPVAVLLGAPMVFPAVLGANAAVAVVASAFRPGEPRSTPRS